MRNILLTVMVLALLGGNASLAQQMQATTPRNPRSPAPTATTGIGVPLPSVPTTRVPAAMLGSRVPGTIPTPAASPLGAITPMAGTPATIASAPAGAITTCTTAPSFSLDASTALISGGLAPPPLPGATIPQSPSFGSSVASGICNPATGTQNTIEALGIAAVVAPTPGLAPITGPSYSDATVPQTFTEAGSGGLSPLIDVPAPVPCAVTPVPLGPTTTPSAITPTAPTSTTLPSSTLTTPSPGC